MTLPNSVPPYVRDIHCAPDDKKWVIQKLAGLPANVAYKLANEYNFRYNQAPKKRSYARKNGPHYTSPARNANLFLREAVATLEPMLSGLLIPIAVLKREHSTEKYIEAKHRFLFEHSVGLLERAGDLEEYSEQLKHVLSGLVDYMRENDLAFAVPGCLSDLEDCADEFLESQILRLRCVEHLKRKAQAYRNRTLEHIAIAAGMVKKGAQPYISENSLRQWKHKKHANLAWLKAMVAENTVTGQQIDLKELVDKSSANPEHRRIELMVRLRGFEELAEELGHKAYFLTWTAPSAFHRSSKKWNGADPRQTQSYLVAQWAKLRAALHRANINWFGFRVTEPHHDATPHWHLLVFVAPKQVKPMLARFKHYALEHDASEKGAKQHRFKIDFIDPAKGSATGYLAKYIAKNINANHMDGEKDHETNTDSASGAIRAQAWASWHKIRQFQQFGGAPVTLWRELRRMGSDPSHDKLIEPARQAADKSRWAEFCKTAQSLAIVYECTGTNEYNEPTKRPRGVVGATVTEVTRLTQWAIKCARSALKKGDSRPWSTVSNCTQALIEQVNDHLKSCLGIDDSHSTAVLLHGGQVAITPHKSIRLRGNQLIEMRR
ncbi:replication endonuclease [Agarivorans sp. QJM3NY_25]|uniref:replication endonuclease n=1 Tax=Agarivorans sp. QJM3NY_25 TaxID=3421430 RepID=UPI003D7ED7C7